MSGASLQLELAHSLEGYQAQAPHAKENGDPRVSLGCTGGAQPEAPSLPPLPTIRPSTTLVHRPTSARRPQRHPAHSPQPRRGAWSLPRSEQPAAQPRHWRRKRRRWPGCRMRWASGWSWKQRPSGCHSSDSEIQDCPSPLQTCGQPSACQPLPGSPPRCLSSSTFYLSQHKLPTHTPPHDLARGAAGGDVYHVS